MFCDYGWCSYWDCCMSIVDFVLEIDCLILCLLCVEDFDVFLCFCSDLEVMQYFGGVMFFLQVWCSFSCLVGSWYLYGFLMFLVIEKVIGVWVGCMGLWQLLDWFGIEVGWSICCDSWGKGYVFEVVVVSIDWVFDILGWDEVIYIIELFNVNFQVVVCKFGSMLLCMGELLLLYVGVLMEIWGQLCV